jgi:hypothetical protein
MRFPCSTRWAGAAESRVAAFERPPAEDAAFRRAVLRHDPERVGELLVVIPVVPLLA